MKNTNTISRLSNKQKDKNDNSYPCPQGEIFRPVVIGLIIMVLFILINK